MIVTNHNKTMLLRMVKRVLPVFLFLMFSFVSKAQSCDAVLTVEKNRSFKSVQANGIPSYFILNLKNTGVTAKEFEVVISEMQDSCDNGTNRSATQNTPLQYKVSTSENNIVPSNRILVQGGQTKQFKVKVSATAQSEINMWGCLNVSVQYQGCTSASQVVLSSFIPDPKAN